MANQFHRRSVSKQRKVGKQSDWFGASLVWKSLRSSPFAGEYRRSDPASGGLPHSEGPRAPPTDNEPTNRAHSGNPAFRRPSISSFEFD
jgi:hypothetical protein